MVSFRKRCLLSVPILLMVMTSHAPIMASAEEPEQRVSKTKAFSQMIDSLANRNPAPKLTTVGFTKPIFPEDFDWNEQARVNRVFIQLRKNESEELWEELIKHLHDERYSLTMMDFNEFAHNYSVGDLCYKIAYNRLYAGIEEHRAVNDIGRPVYLETGIKNMLEWRKKRARKKLWELQAEVCELALKDIPNAKGISEQARIEMRKKIEAQIDELKKTKKPVFVKFPVDSYDLYKPEAAKRIREKLERSPQK
jgi:hypothetical protein